MNQQYWDGLQDGALQVLAPALGVEPKIGQPAYTLIGRRFTVSIEWLDSIDEQEVELAREFAVRAIARIAERTRPDDPRRYEPNEETPSA